MSSIRLVNVSKQWEATKALDGIVRDGQLLAVGGFGLCGIPSVLIAELHRAMVSEAAELRRLAP